MFWIGFGVGIVVFILVFCLLAFFAGCRISGEEAERERQRMNMFYPSAVEPELEPGEIAEWNPSGYWEFYKNGEHIRDWPEWSGEPV